MMRALVTSLDSLLGLGERDYAEAAIALAMAATLDRLLTLDKREEVVRALHALTGSELEAVGRAADACKAHAVSLACLREDVRREGSGAES